MIEKYRKPVKDLLTRLEKAGFELAGVMDGLCLHTQYQSNFHAFILSVDESHLIVRKDNGEVTIFLVLGNGEWEIVTDYVTSSEELMSEMDEITEAFSDYWLMRG